ncbi:MAG TPA: hypothetical protein VE999_11905 [Gemmataceae bacterium]|nr:hypothetical protein [Gemmataceae bacterium]
MNRRMWISASVLLALVGLLLGWSLLTAQAPKSSRAIPEGFSGEYVLIEKNDGGFVLLHKPEVRSLAGKRYLVGSTISLSGVTDDELFGPLAQWVDLEKIRRMGEANRDSVIGDIGNIAERLKSASATK